MMSACVLARHAQALGQVWGYRSGHANVTKRAAPAAARGLTIALARQPGTPAGEVARAVGAQLDWPVYDRELLQRVAEEMGLPVRSIEPFDEQPPRWFLDCLQMVGAPSPAGESRYVHHLTRVIRTLGEVGLCVIVGRGAAQILPARTTLRVHLVGHLEDRVAAVRDGCGLDWNAAGRRVVQLERAWTRFVLDNFHRDPQPAHSYDLVLNTSQWPVERCGDLIVQAARSLAATVPVSAA
jgi:cytidylate kinase